LLGQWQLPAAVFTAAVQYAQTDAPSFMTFWILAQAFIDFRVFIFSVCYTAFVNNIYRVLAHCLCREGPFRSTVPAVPVPYT